MDPDDEDAEDGAAADVDAQRKGKCVVLKTSTRQTVFLPVSPPSHTLGTPGSLRGLGCSSDVDWLGLAQVVGLVDADKLKPGDLVGVNKDSYLVLDMLPAEYDSRVKVSASPQSSSTLLTLLQGVERAYILRPPTN